nr:hypothetical protein [Myxococcota bacterium]
ACFRAAIARAPLLADAHEWLGRMLLEAGYLVDARARLDDAIAMSPYVAPVNAELSLGYALQGDWEEADRVAAGLGDAEPAGGIGYRLRFAVWRGDHVAEARWLDELRHRGPTRENAIAAPVYDREVPWSERAAVLQAWIDGADLSARRRSFLCQLAIEAAMREGDVPRSVALLAVANEGGLFDLAWLERCPLLGALRGSPIYDTVRASVAERAEAIHDALYGDHGALATAPTTMNARP